MVCVANQLGQERHWSNRLKRSRNGLRFSFASTKLNFVATRIDYALRGRGPLYLGQGCTINCHNHSIWNWCLWQSVQTSKSHLPRPQVMEVHNMHAGVSDCFLCALIIHSHTWICKKIALEHRKCSQKTSKPRPSICILGLSVSIERMTATPPCLARRVLASYYCNKKCNAHGLI